jgi:hypothetical protein
MVVFHQNDHIHLRQQHLQHLQYVFCPEEQHVIFYRLDQ